MLTTPLKLLSACLHPSRTHVTHDVLLFLNIIVIHILYVRVNQQLHSCILFRFKTLEQSLYFLLPTSWTSSRKEYHDQFWIWLFNFLLLESSDIVVFFYIIFLLVICSLSNCPLFPGAALERAFPYLPLILIFIHICTDAARIKNRMLGFNKRNFSFKKKDVILPLYSSLASVCIMRRKREYN